MSMSQDEMKYQSGEPETPENAGENVIISPDTRRENRIPAGQSRTRKWPVLHYGRVPIVPLDSWWMDIFGLVETPLSLSWEEFQALPRVKVFSDFHCVTRWSRLGNIWEGVSVRELLNRTGIKSEAKFIVATGYDDGWTTNLPLEDFLAEDALIVDIHDGEPLSADHGGPARLVVPLLYAWKSAKWLKSIELTAQDRPGLWEQAGYHNHGDPWVQSNEYPDGERFQTSSSPPPGYYE
jgi:DMSO/TMAO reductase YedYZ molybdopterin-dependent catalytic subunit